MVIPNIPTVDKPSLPFELIMISTGAVVGVIAVLSMGAMVGGNDWVPVSGAVDGGRVAVVGTGASDAFEDDVDIRSELIIKGYVKVHNSDTRVESSI